MLNKTNGHGSATHNVERGISVAHRRKDTKDQRAAKAAAVYDERISYQPTLREVAQLYGVTVGRVNRARRLAREKRLEVASGRAALPPFLPPRLGLPKTSNGKSDDAQGQLVELISRHGLEATLVAAALVEQQQQQT